LNWSPADIPYAVFGPKVKPSFLIVVANSIAIAVNEIVDVVATVHE